MTSTMPLTELPCPKCALPMRVIERSGVTIEQCRECRGVFLDRGELDRLLDLEAGASSIARPRERVEPWHGDRPMDPSRDSGHDDDDDWSQRSRGGRDPRRRRGFLGEFFEGFGD